MSEEVQETKTTKVMRFATFGIIAMVLMFGVIAAFGGGSESGGSKNSAPASQQQMF